MNDIPPPPVGRCPVCGKPTTQPHRPFCSGRCRSVDLHRWLHGVYRVETEEGPDEAPDEQG